MSYKRILIVGGVAGGASCAARLRRLSEEAEIIILERGPFVSFANCGLPYHVGNVISEEKKLLMATPELFQKRFNIEVRLENEVKRIDPAIREIEVLEKTSGRIYREPYDALILSPGASPLRPPLPGIDLPGIYSLRTIPDTRKIREWIETRNVREAVVVGGGFIGLEMTENLVHRGLSVTLVEMLPQVMPPLDPEMAVPIQSCLTNHGIRLSLGNPVRRFERNPDGSISVHTSSGESFRAGMVIIALGVKPEVELARQAGLALGSLGGIRVDEQMRTSDPSIWAVGDAVEVRDVVTGAFVLLPLAGPANRQGRVAADAIVGRSSQFRGVQGTAVCGIFNLTIACTGANEKKLLQCGRAYKKVFLHPAQHVGYYPGAKPMTLKILFDPTDGKLLGAQAVGEEGVERRIDVLSMAIEKEASVYDLEEAELCYAPQYGAAKDPVNLAGMIAANTLRGDNPLSHWEDLSGSSALIVDVREPHEYAAGHVPGAINLPLSELRGRSEELPRDREIWIHCGVGQRSYYALRFLEQNGYKVRNLSGGYQTYKMVHARAQF
jgi:NADPH-dependent 2,4-dienoyl-CoA reductase/sulfur reductase-like enzyme/rhodanese-related sulfurtransferase